MELRKITYKLYPKPEQADRLFEVLRLHKELYNAALEERIDAYRKAGISISYANQCASLTEIRRDLPEHAAVNCSSQQRTLRRLDIAFKAFFDRVKKGQTPGFPRFKSLNRFPGFGYKTHGDGWRFMPGKDWRNGTLRLQCIGYIKARGRARQGGTIKACEVLHRGGQWFLSLTIEAERFTREVKGTAACGLDWGVESLLSLVDSDGRAEQIENPRWYKTQKERELALERSRDRKKRGSNRRRKAAIKVARFKAKTARKRLDHHHKLSARIAADYAVAATEALSIKNMTRSAKGAVDEPGKRVAQKAGLNREILDTAPAQLFSMIRCKVSETGGWFIETPTRKLKPSQRCPKCWTVKKKTLDERHHYCPCGHDEPRDIASARVNLIWALAELSGQELAETG